MREIRIRIRRKKKSRITYIGGVSRKHKAVESTPALIRCDPSKKNMEDDPGALFVSKEYRGLYCL